MTDTETRRSRRALGQCTDCGRETHDGKSRCGRHRRVHNENERAARAQRRADGQCSWCGKDAEGKALCRPCQASRRTHGEDIHS